MPTGHNYPKMRRGRPQGGFLVLTLRKGGRLWQFDTLRQPVSGENQRQG